MPSPACTATELEFVPVVPLYRHTQIGYIILGAPPPAGRHVARRAVGSSRPRCPDRGDIFDPHGRPSGQDPPDMVLAPAFPAGSGLWMRSKQSGPCATPGMSGGGSIGPAAGCTTYRGWTPSRSSCVTAAGSVSGRMSPRRW